MKRKSTISAYTVGDLIAEYLYLIDIKKVFGVISVHNLPLLESINNQGKIYFVMCRGEAGAGHMADGYARANRTIGAFFTSTGAGAANAAPALLEALTANTPLLHFTGQNPLNILERDLGAVHDVPHQLLMLKTISKKSYRITSNSNVLDILLKATKDALKIPRGPVSIEIPIDIQRQHVSRPSQLDKLKIPSFDYKSPSKKSLDQMRSMIIAAHRPMLWIGSGSVGVEKEILSFLNFGWAMVSSWKGRAIIDENNPQSLGAINGLGSPSLEEFYESVDLLIVCGSRLRAHETRDGVLKLPKNIIRIDIDPKSENRNYPNNLFINADVKKTLSSALNSLDEKYKIADEFKRDFKYLKDKVIKEYSETLGPYSNFANQLQSILPAHSVWARDITISHTTWGTKLVKLKDFSQNIYPVGAGIGQGFALGIGAACSRSDEITFILTGDGGFQLGMNEFWTMIQEKLKIILIIMNDNGYGVIKHMQNKLKDKKYFYSNLIGPDIERLMSSQNINYLKVSNSEDFRKTLLKAVKLVNNLAAPVIVEVDMDSIGAHPPYFPYNK